MATAIGNEPLVGPEAWAARSGPKYYEKNTIDMHDTDDTFLNARDLGNVRLNYTRLNLVSSITAKQDSTDTYSFNIISTGKLRLTVRDSEIKADANGPLDLSQHLKDAGIEVVEEKAETTTNTADLNRTSEVIKADGPLDLTKHLIAAGLIPETPPEPEVDNLDNKLSDATETYQDVIDNFSAKNVRVKVYIEDGRRQKLIADSGGEEGSDEFNAYTKLTRGEMSIRQKGKYFVTVERKEGVAEDKDNQYMVQVQMGDKHEHEYMTIENKATDPQPMNQNGITGGTGLSTAQLSMNSMIAANSSAISLMNGGASMTSASAANMSANSLLISGYNTIASLNYGSSRGTVQSILG